MEGEGNSSSVLCLTPSTLYKLCLWDAADFAEAKSAQQLQKKKRKEIRLLNLSSDSEGDKDPQEKPVVRSSSLFFFSHVSEFKL